LAPHFAEEVYENYSNCFNSPQPTVFRSGWLDAPEEWNNVALREEFQVVKQLRVEVNQLLEQARAAKLIGPSSEATVEIQLSTGTNEDSGVLADIVDRYTEDFSKLFITSAVTVTRVSSTFAAAEEAEVVTFTRDVEMPKVGSCRLVVRRSTLNKCPRCWSLVSLAQDTLCTRCQTVVDSLDLEL
jgi:isoleucyl-tRNA synthetase